jgi:MHS family proline/betaine transporter-like MFS transporter
VIRRVTYALQLSSRTCVNAYGRSTWLTTPGTFWESLNVSGYDSRKPQTSIVRTIIAGAIGNVLEWYDFGLFGFFAPVIAREFLPAEDRLASLLGTFGIYATGFLMRPIGGVVFGHVGDRFGRKRALELSVLLMAVATTVMGLLPAHATIGLAAPCLLTLVRLLQGLSVGGEYIGSMSFLAEHAPSRHRAFVGSWSSFSTVLGTLLGSGTAALLTGLLSEAQVLAWGWRLPFLSGFLIGLVGLWLRLGVEESPRFVMLQKSGKIALNPVAESLRNDRGPIAITLGLAAISSVGYYLPFVWLPTWLSHINQPSLAESQALWANTIALLALLLLTPLTALVSDRVGRKPMFLAAAAGYAIFSYPLFRMMAGGRYTDAVFGGLIFASCNGLYSGCMGATMVELFPTRTRYSGVAIGYNIGQALLGGTAPFVGTALIELTGNDLAPTFYLIASAIVAGAAALFIKPWHGLPLEAVS